MFKVDIYKQIPDILMLIEDLWKYISRMIS